MAQSIYRASIQDNETSMTWPDNTQAKSTAYIYI